MIHIVSGFMRSGTSMMMRCLEAGRLTPVLSPKREVTLGRFGDEHYKPNPEGFYELEAHQFRERWFPQMYAGKVVKILWGGLDSISVGEHKYRIVFMLRHPEEIRQSYEAFFGTPHRLVAHADLNMKPDAPYWLEMRDTIGIARQRRDVELIELNYRDVVESPKANFELLTEAGWPLDVDAMVEMVNPKYCRFRLENIEVGI